MTSKQSKRPIVRNPVKKVNTAKINPSKPKPIMVSEVSPGVWMTDGAINRYAVCKSKVKKK